MLIAQLCYNNSVNKTIRMTPFFINHRYNTNLFLESKEATVLTEEAAVKVQDMWKVHEELKRDIEFLSHQSAFYHNKHRHRAPMLKEGNKVYLLQKNIQTTRPSTKLDHFKIESFRIIRNIKETSFKLDLLTEMRIHLIFHVSLLKSAPANISVLQQVSDNYLMKQEEWYEVQKILAHKEINSEWHYLVKWKNYSDSENTWELTVNLNRCK